MKLPVCPVHRTELSIKGPHYLECDEVVHKGNRNWKCQHGQYFWPGDLYDIFNIERKNQ